MDIEQIKTVDLTALQRFIELESDAFGTGGLNEWTLVPLIRHGRVYAAYQAGEVIGLIEYILDWNNPQRAYMMGVSMAKKVRGQGLGTVFIAKTLQILADDGINEVELTVAPDNQAAIYVYQKKLGFTAKKIRKEEYGKDEDRIIMLLSL
ncbi:MAG: GNAT family N-acetyltransferase [Pelosinus sp.]|nr:GNAT family N-acetyltransferase [Pelosinus sp.]